MIEYVVFGALIFLLIWTTQQKKWRLTIKVPTIVSLSSVLFLLLVYLIIKREYLGKDSWYNIAPYMQIIFYIFMIAGMGVRYITKAIEDRREKIVELKKKSEEFEKPKLEFDKWEFSYPFFFSFITFGLLLKQIDIEMITTSNLILSFQTGFFWQTILKKAVPE